MLAALVFTGTEFSMFAGLACALVLFPVVCLWQICGKAGYAPAMSLIALVPGGVVVLLGILAFARWPSRQLARSRSGIARPSAR